MPCDERIKIIEKFKYVDYLEKSIPTIKIDYKISSN